MIKNFTHSLIFILFFLLFRCGEANYILNEETPPILKGFFGFRWTTPMGIVDSEFPKLTGAKTQSNLNRYNTSNFSDAYFLGELTTLCRFTFSESGLRSVKIIFNTNHLTYDAELFELKEKLANVYGEPVELLGIVDYPTLPEYLVRYSWIEGRLNITLNLDYTLEINAYGISPLLGPIFNLK
ncbi:MAG: hypothetical protein WBQ32_11095 [Ignavibacteriaceae bacterium]